MLRNLTITSRLFAVVLVLVFIGGVSCGRPAVYEEHVNIPEAGWDKDSVISFSVDIKDTTSGYELKFYLRNNHEYPYQNIYFFRNVASERGTEFADTAEYRLADPYGKWLGTGVGSIRSHEWPFRESRVFFNQSGTYTFKIQHAMRTDLLEGIESIGMGVFKAEKDQVQ